MPFVQCSVGYGDEQGNNCPIPAPTVARSTHADEHRSAEYSKFRHVSQLADQNVGNVQLPLAQGGNEPMKEWNDDAAGVIRAEIVGGESGYQNSDANGGNPVGQSRHAKGHFG